MSLYCGVFVAYYRFLSREGYTGVFCNSTTNVAAGFPNVTDKTIGTLIFIDNVGKKRREASDPYSEKSFEHAIKV